jgi:hypothetical protein
MIEASVSDLCVTTFEEFRWYTILRQNLLQSAFLNGNDTRVNTLDITILSCCDFYFAKIQWVYVSHSSLWMGLGWWTITYYGITVAVSIRIGWWPIAFRRPTYSSNYCEDETRTHDIRWRGILLWVRWFVMITHFDKILSSDEPRNNWCLLYWTV